MTSNLERFFRERPVQNNRLKTIDSNINSYGDFTELTDIDAVIKNIETDLLINKGTYLFDPEFGVGIHKFVFEPANEFTKTKLEQLISGVVNRNKAHSTVSFQVFFFQNRKGFKINLTVEYKGIRKEKPIMITDKLLRTIG